MVIIFFKFIVFFFSCYSEIIVNYEWNKNRGSRKIRGEFIKKEVVVLEGV